MKKFYIFILLILPLYLFSQNKYQSGQLFAMLKKENVFSTSVSIFSINPDIKPYGISSFERAFKLNDAPLDRIFLIKFRPQTGDIEKLIEYLMATNLFEYVEKVPLHSLDYTPNDIQSRQWNLAKIMAEKAWDIQKGSSNIVIGVVDDALDTAHQDLEPIIWRNKGEIRGNSIDDDGNGYIDDYIGWDAADNDNDPTTGDSLSHGTHCAGIAGAATDNNTGIASIAFGCKILIAKIGSVGYSYLINAYQGVEYAIINKVNVISMSWGGGGYSATEQLLFDNAFKKGIVCVAAAGNSKTNYIHYPSGYNHVIAVGSTTSSDKVSSFSNYGTWVDVMAPGSNIYSTLLSNTYGNYSGTSMATPLVSGLCALMLSKNPNATPTEIENCLKSGCENIDNLNSSYIGEMGAGRINAENSLKCLKPIYANFTSNYIQICPGDTITFTDISKPAPTSFKWTFTGGSPSGASSSKPKIRYATAGNYDVKLIVFGAGSATDTIIKKNYIKVAKPTATLSGNRTIQLGNSTNIKIDFTGTAPYSFKISDGTNTQTITNISYSPYYYAIKPSITTTYKLTAFNDSKCVGNYSGNSIITVNTGKLKNYNCLKVSSLSKINSNSTGFSNQLDDGDYFGQTVRNFGDFDGDGIEDLIVGSQLDDDGGGNQGAVYIILLNSNGSVKSFQKISATQGGFTGNLSGNNYFGSGVSKLTDLDGDGVNDLVVGQNYDNTGNARAGAVWIIFLNANGTVKAHQKIANGVGGFPNILDSDDIFGNDVSEIGDVNKDGLTDILVGAPYDDDGGTDRGAVYIICLNKNGTVKSYQKISSSAGNMSGLINDDAFGYGLSGSFDFNKDGYKDIVVGARKDNDGGTDRGAVWILYLDSNNRVKSTQKISSTSGNFTGALDNSDYFGTGVEIIGDINNDSITDIAVSATYDDDGGTDRGASWILMLNKNGTVKSHLKISSTTQAVLKNKIDNDDLFSWRLSYLNDIDNDGFKEIVVGAMLDDDGGTNRGAVYILNLNDTCFIKPSICKLYPNFSFNSNCVSDSITFKDLSTDSLNNSIIKWDWDFGNGLKKQGSPLIKMMYNTIGTYSVKLVATSNADNICKDSITKSVIINNNFFIHTSGNDTICKNDTAYINANIAFCGTKPFTFQWSPSITLSNPLLGNTAAFPTQTTKYTLIVTDKFGQKAYDTLTIKVDSSCCRSFAQFNINKTLFCFEDSLKINNTSKNKVGAIYNWIIAPTASNNSFSGKTPPNITFTKSGYYTIKLTLNDSCGTDTMVKTIFVLPKSNTNAGKDTTLCLNDSLQIGDIGIGRNTYLWLPNVNLSNNKISNPKTFFKGNITYYLKTINEDGCTALDTINLSKPIEPKLNLGNDTTICIKDSFTLKSNIIANSYLWNTGKSANFIKAKTDGNYWLQTKTICLQSDTIKLNFKAAANFTLGNDSIICNKTTYTLLPNINTTGFKLLWDNSSTNSSRIINSDGKYWLKIDNLVCESSDTVNINFSKTPFVDLGKDTLMCNNVSIILNATDINAKNYLWNDGATIPIKTISNKGNYKVELSNSCGKFEDDINISIEYDALPFLGNDTTICNGDTLTLKVKSPYAKYYLWNDNSNLQTKKVFVSGNYNVTTGNKCGDFDTSINILTKNCDCNIFMPNVFSPNRTIGNNDLLFPIVALDCEPIFYKMQIFDRWGSQIFEANKLQDGWNGKYQNKNVPPGVYVWILTIQQPFMNKNVVFKKSGSVIILE